MRPIIILAVSLAASAACAPDDAPTPEHPPAAEAQPTAQPDGLIKGTPPGDLEDWVADLRRGLGEVKTLLESDGARAHARVLDLYVTRQEYLEMYYGPGGRMKPPAPLAAAVKRNEEHFHALMQLTGAQPADASAIRPAL